MSKLDVLDTFPEIKVCVAYDVNGVRHRHLPYHQSDLHAAVPVYETFPGWMCDLSSATERGDLPAAAVTYLQFLEEEVGVPITYVGTGPERGQYVHLGS